MLTKVEKISIIRTKSGYWLSFSDKNNNLIGVIMAHSHRLFKKYLRVLNLPRMVEWQIRYRFENKESVVEKSFFPIESILVDEEKLKKIMGNI